MNKSNGIHKFSKVISTVLVILLCVGLIGAIISLTNGFQNDIPTFAVMYNDENVANKSGVRLALGANSQFTVKTLTGKAQDCSVKVFVNEIHNFDFTIDGEKKSFAAEGDITDGFDIAVSKDNVITITLAENASIQTVLAKKHYGTTVIVPADKITDNDYFKLQITMSGGTSVFVGFSFAEIRIENPLPDSMVQGIKLDTSEVTI